MAASVFGPRPDPASPLARHRILSPTAAVRVSPLCLGGLSFGNAMKGHLGECSKETAFEIMDHFYESGGNFIDTANSYQAEESETWIGEWMEQRGNRDQMVIATKFSSDYFERRAGPKDIRSNYTGNSHKSLHVSLEASLKKLKTSYIDILYVHWWDFTASVEEVMQSLNRMVTAGKVLYLGISDTPAYIVTKANQYARDHGLKQFSIYQGRWSAAERDMERDVVPMAQLEGMALAPWGTLGQGNLRTPTQAQTPKTEGRNMGAPSQKYMDVAVVLERVAHRHGTAITSVALAYVLHVCPDVYPICGGRKVEHLKSNIAALTLRLSDDEMVEIENAYDFEPGFPMGFLFQSSHYSQRLTPADVFLTRHSAVLDAPQRRGPAFPPQGK